MKKCFNITVAHNGKLYLMLVHEENRKSVKIISKNLSKLICLVMKTAVNFV